MSRGGSRADAVMPEANPPSGGPEYGQPVQGERREEHRTGVRWEIPAAGRFARRPDLPSRAKCSQSAYPSAGRADRKISHPADGIGRYPINFRSSFTYFGTAT